MNEKAKVGRPQRYEGEKNVQLSVSIRPRYRQALELIAQVRQSTLSEALELAIFKQAEELHIDNQPVIDFVRPENEILEMIYDSLDISNRETQENFRDNVFPPSKPLSMFTPLERYKAKVMWDLPNGEIGGPFDSGFTYDSLSEAVTEAWKTGESAQSTYQKILAVWEYNEHTLWGSLPPPFEEIKDDLLELIRKNSPTEEQEDNKIKHNKGIQDLIEEQKAIIKIPTLTPEIYKEQEKAFKKIQELVAQLL